MRLRPRDKDDDASSDTGDIPNDRRRPGRTNCANRFLISLLRRQRLDQFSRDPETEGARAFEYRPDEEENDPLRASKGIFAAVLIGLIFWGLIGVAIRLSL